MSGKGTLVVVPSERYASRIAQAGARVETRGRLRTRLFEALVIDRAAATPVEARLALAASIGAIADGDALLGPIARGAGEAWERTIDAVDAALGALRTAGVRVESLARIAQARGAIGARGRALHDAMRAVDERLAARSLVDPRAVGTVLAERIAAVPPARVANAVGAKSVLARFVVEWDGADAAWWRALDAALSRAGGEGARVELPSFDAPIDASRERDPLETVLEDVARALDAAPVTVAIEPVLGDLRMTGSAPAAGRVALIAASDAEGQARAVVDAVKRALAAGVEVEGVAIAAGRFDEAAVAPLRRAFDEAGIPLHDARGEAPAEAGAVTFAFDALALAERGLPRLDVAALARSQYVDPARLGIDEGALADLARALERTPTASGADAREGLIATARAVDGGRGGSWRSPEEEAARGEARVTLAGRLADLLLPAARTMARAEHVAVARELLGALGVDAMRARDLADEALASDAPATGLARAELRALARDARAWELFHAALTDYEASIARLGLSSSPATPRAFRHELARALAARAGRPGGARAGAVRVAPLAELAAEELALLVVIDANEGALPSSGGADGLVSDALAASLRTMDPARAPVTAGVRVARELSSLATAASGARAIVLARRTRDDEGSAIAPAPLVAWLERGGITAATWRASPLDGPAVDGREARLRRLVARPRPASVDARIARRAHVERTREARFERSAPPEDELLGDLAARDPIAADLARALGEDTGGGQRPLAVTSLERFATCAFQGYALEVLRARADRPVRELPDVRERGSLLHQALAAAFTATAPLWAERPRDAPRIRAEALAAAMLTIRPEGIASALRRLSLERLRDAVVAVIEWSLRDMTWDFARAEQPFGDGRPGSWPALVLDDGDARLTLRGSIDRVDVGHGRAAVRALDYKSSTGSAEAGLRGLGETAFQVALYARAAADALTARERSGLYVAAPRPDDVGPKLRSGFEATWSALHEPCGPVTAIEARALSIVRGVRAGGLGPRPYDDRACAKCDVSGGCRKPRFAIRREDDE